MSSLDNSRFSSPTKISRSNCENDEKEKTALGLQCLRQWGGHQCRAISAVPLVQCPHCIFASLLLQLFIYRCIYTNIYICFWRHILVGPPHRGKEMTVRGIATGFYKILRALQCFNVRMHGNKQTNKQAANNAPSGFSPDHAVRRASILRNVAIYDLGKFTRFLSPVYRRARRQCAGKHHLTPDGMHLVQYKYTGSLTPDLIQRGIAPTSQ